MNVTVVVGTRPEAIKLAPVIRELKSRAGVATRVVATAQHRELLDQALAVFGIVPDADLAVMQAGQELGELTARVLIGMQRELSARRPDALVVQGDTTTVFAASLAAFYQGVAVAHVEAGLRSGDPRDPYPEEMNRRLTAPLARWHFAPTVRARDNLLREGVPDALVHVTGNTVVDALRAIVAMDRFREARLPDGVVPGRRTLLVTLHRRENWGERLAGMCAALNTIANHHPDCQIVLPVHLNPVVRDTIEAHLAHRPQVHLVEPLDYVTFLKVLEASTLVLTDSGGVQEEAPVFGKPVLVLRETTERPEAIDAGVARRIGTTSADISGAVDELLENRREYERMAQAVSPFGDGLASARIADVLLRSMEEHR